MEDYKTGNPPTARQMTLFDRQLFLEALLVERGSVSGLPATPVSAVAHIGLGSKPSVSLHPLEPGHAQESLDKLESLLGAYRSVTQGFTSRRMPYRVDDLGEYDHLARFGEWLGTDAPDTVQW